SQKRDIGYFDNLKADSGNVTNSMTFVTKSSNQNFIIFLNKIQTTIIGYKRSRIWLFGFNPYFFQHNSLGTTKRVGLQCCAQMGFLVLFIMLLLDSMVATELPGSMKTATLARPASAMGLSERATLLYTF
ncbi:hypothetical protein K5549_020609, partial [Capra hircus]